MTQDSCDKSGALLEAVGCSEWLLSHGLIDEKLETSCEDIEADVDACMLV